jgi:hypothetical protein
MSRPWRSQPPRNREGDLAPLVSHYIDTFAPNRRRGLRWYASAGSLREAITRAATARTEDGPLESHQRRQGHALLRRWERRLQAVRGRIGLCASFDELHDCLWERRVPHVGPLTVYDTATRLGAFLGLRPRAVYLHTGALAGAKALGLDTTGGRVARHALPEPLRRLAPDEVEDFLCIYKGLLGGRRRFWPAGCLPPPRGRRVC